MKNFFGGKKKIEKILTNDKKLNHEIPEARSIVFDYPYLNSHCNYSLFGFPSVDEKSIFVLDTNKSLFNIFDLNTKEWSIKSLKDDFKISR
jgi:hypothetical protein